MKSTWFVAVCACAAGCRDTSEQQRPDAAAHGDAQRLDASADAPAPMLVDGGHLTWARRAGGNGFDAPAGIGMLADGSWLIAGRYSSSNAVFGPGEPQQTTLPASPYGEYDAFLARYDANGSLVWARRVAAGPTFQDDEPTGLFVLPDGSSILSSEYEVDTTVFGDTQNIALTGGTSFIARFDAAGSVVWAHNAPSGSVSGLPDGSVIVAGRGTVTRYAADGTQLWTRNVTTTNYVAMHDVTMLSDGSSVVTGELAGIATFGASEANETTLSASHYDGFVAKYGADGNLAWARTLVAGGFTGTGSSIAPLADGGFAISGYFGTTEGFGSATFAPGQAGAVTLAFVGLDMFVARLDATGMLSWVRTAACSGNEFGFGVAARADASSIVVAGYFGIFGGRTITFGNAPQVQLNATGLADMFVASYTGAGDLRWARRAGGTDSQRTEAELVELFADGSPLVAGIIERGDATFGMGDPTMTTLTAQGNADPFMLRLGP